MNYIKPFHIFEGLLKPRDIISRHAKHYENLLKQFSSNTINGDINLEFSDIKYLNENANNINVRHIKGSLFIRGDIRNLPKWLNGVEVDKFICNRINIKSLSNCPLVHVELNCNDNLLESLEGCPNYLKILRCNNNLLQSLNGSPEEVDIIECSGNFILTFKGSLKKINSQFICNSNRGIKPTNKNLVEAGITGTYTIHGYN